MPYAEGPGGQIVAEPSQTGGLFGALFDPAVQQQRLAAQQAQIQIGQEQAFKNGVPTNPDGSTDYSTMVNRLTQLGDYGNANNFLNTSLAQQKMAIAKQYAGAFGGGGAPPTAGNGQGGAAPAAANGSGVDPLDVYAHSIGNIESNNNYAALGPKQASGDRAYGRFQVMGSNVGPWTKEVLGQAMSPTDFLNNPQAQDAVFKAKFGQSVQQYNNPADAASVWFSGRPIARAGNASDSLGTTVPSYVSKFMAGLGPSSQAVQSGQGNGGGTGVAPTAAANSGSGAQAPLISFGGSGSGSQASSAQPPAASATPTAAGAPIGDAAVMAARNRLAAAQDLDPSSLTQAQQRQLTADTGTVAAYTAQQAQPQTTATAGTGGAPPLTIRGPGNVQVAQNGASDAPSSTHPFGAAPASQPAPPPQATAYAPNPAPGPSALPPSMPVQRPPMAGTTMGGQPNPAAQPPAGGMGGPGPGVAPPQAGPAPISFSPQPGPAPQMAPVRPVAPPPPQPLPQAQPAPNYGNGQTPLMSDPGIAGILQSYKNGKYLNNPGGALMDMRAAQQALNSIGADSTAFGKSADYLEQGIVRSATLTNEQRNARDAAVQADRVQKAQVENAARLAADTDPSRVAFAGNEAAARSTGAAQGTLNVEQTPAFAAAKAANAAAGAAGTALGENSPAAVAARTANASSVAEGTQSGDALGKAPAVYAKDADSANLLKTNVDQMLQASQGFQMGAGASQLQDSRKVMQAAFQAIGVNSPKLNSETASYEDFTKTAGILSRNAASSLGGRTGVQELKMISGSLPSPEQSYDGFRTVAETLKGNGDFTIAKQQAAQNYQQQNGTLNGFDAQWNKNVSPSAFWLHSLATDQPDLFKQATANLGKTPQGQSLLKKSISQLSYLNGQGLLD